MDWLTLAYRVDLDTGVLDYIRERALLTTDDQGKRLPVRVDLQGVAFELKAPRVDSWWVLVNDTVQVRLDERAAGGWTVEVTLSGSAMMTLAGGEAVSVGRRVALLFGTIEEMRVRRVDLAIDIAGWKIRDADGANFVTWGRVTKHVEIPESDGAVYEWREYRARSSLVTGFAWCPGNALMARIYNKREELSFRPEKREAEEATWRANGWDGEAPVTRVEWQLRGEALDELKLRDPERLLSHADELLAYLTRWGKLIVPGTATRRSRCDLDDRWDFIRSIRFDPHVVPLVRDRSHRGGASARQVLGALLSSLARNDDLPASPPLLSPDGEILNDEKEFGEAMSQVQAKEWLRTSVAMLHARHVDHLVAELAGTDDYRGGARILLQRWRAVEARRSRILVLEMIKKRRNATA